MFQRAAGRLALVAIVLMLATVPVASSPMIAPRSHPIALLAPTISSVNKTLTPPLPSLPLPAIGYSAQAGQFGPVSGVIHVLVIAAAFPDVNYTLSIDQVKRNWFGPVAEYYHEASFGKLTVEGDIYGWYTLPYPEAHYGKSCLSINDAGCDGEDAAWQVAQDAVHIAGNSINFKNYDYFIFIHSGYGQESSGVKDDIWSVTWMGGMYIETPTKTIGVFSIVPELEAAHTVPSGVYCLEFGHDLGLPDLYNTNSHKTILGPWELMDKGAWNGDPPGSSPAHMTAWDKIQLGWISGPELATVSPGGTSSFTVDPTEVVSSGVHAIQIPLGSDAESSNPSQYYLVEVRSLTGFDAALPAAGVLITYVDNTAIIGRVHVIDGHPITANLMDAVWNTGQTFTDSQNKLSVAITGKSGNSYQVTVNRGGTLPPQPQIQNQTYVQLGIQSVAANPSTITTANTTVTINIQIYNQGNSAAANIPVQVKLDGEELTNLQIPNIGANTSAQTSFTWVSTLGNHVFQVILDPNSTIKEPSRANNIVTFNIYVGPTLGPILIVNLPTNLASNNVWVSINGIKYNITSGRFQSWVPNNTITLQIQSTVNTSIGVRQVFSGWSDGSVVNPRRVAVTGNTTLQAIYQTQYLLYVDPNGGTTTSGGWYSPNSVTPVSATTPSNVVANESRLVFDDWSGDVSSTSPTLQLNMTKPFSLKANWNTQYYVTIMSPTGFPTGSGWYNAGQIATVGVQSTVQYSNGTRQLFAGWNSTQLGQTPTGQIAVNAPTILETTWKTQYLIKVQSPFGTPEGSGWYDVGSTTYASVPQEIDYGNGTRRVFSAWTGDLTGSDSNMSLSVNSPKSISAQWLTQYLVTFKVTGIPNSTILKLNVNNAYYDLSIGQESQAWYTKGSSINPSLNQTFTNGFMIYKFDSWQGSAGTAQAPITVNSPETYTASYTTQMSIPAIPGFPIEAIFLGILLGLVVMARARKRRQPISQ